MCSGATAFHSRRVLTLVGAVTRHHHVVGLGGHLAGRTPDRTARLVLDPATELHRVAEVRPSETPTACRWPARDRDIRPGSRAGFPARTCRIRSGCRSPSRAGPGWPSNRENTPPAGPGRHCPAPRRAPDRPHPPGGGHAAPAPAPRPRSCRAQPARCPGCARSGTPSTGSRRDAPCWPGRRPGWRPSAATAARAQPARVACIRSMLEAWAGATPMVFKRC
jgi:hypothetical protein